MPKSEDNSSDSSSEEDRKARDEFAERLRKRDKDKTRNITIINSGILNYINIH